MVVALGSTDGSARAHRPRHDGEFLRGESRPSQYLLGSSERLSADRLVGSGGCAGWVQPHGVESRRDESRRAVAGGWGRSGGEDYCLNWY